MDSYGGGGGGGGHGFGGAAAAGGYPSGPAYAEAEPSQQIMVRNVCLISTLILEV